MGSKEQQARAFNNTLKTLNQTVNNTLKCYEWLPTDDCTSPLDDNAVWSTLDGEWELDITSETPAWKQIEYEIMRRGNENRINYNCDAYRSILDRIAKSKLPPCIATDGSHDGDDNSGAIVVFIFEGDGDWTTDEWTPVLARLKRLPSRVGFEDADCGTGEAAAIALAEEVLPPQLPAWILSDSRILAGAYRIMRDAIFPSNRKFIKSLSGVGKGSMIRILKDLALWSRPTMEFLKSQSSILNVYGMPKEQYRFTGEAANLSYECLDENDSDDDEDDIDDPMTAHDILQWHRNKLDKEALKNSVEWQSSNFLGPYYKQEEQKKKLMDLQRALRGMISNDPNKPWHEVDTDTNPHRICVTVRSHQIHKVTRKPSERFKELSPCKTLVQMNDMVDRVCDITFDDDEEDDALECDAMECGEEDGEGMEVELRGPTEDLPFEIFSLRFVIFFEGRQVTKNVSKLVKKQHNNERRLKLSARDYNGLLARNEDDIDITAQELGNRGSSARHMRGQGSYRLRTQRLNPQFNLLTILDTDNSVPASLQPLEQLSDDIIKKYLKEEEFHKGVYNLCPHCGEELIERHRLIVDDLRSSYLNLNKKERAIEHNRSITDDVTLPIEVDRFDWRRSSPLHATICMMETMIQARDLGNLLVNNAVKTLIDMAEGFAVKHSFRNGTVTLYNHMMEEFKKYECETFLGSLGSSNGKYGIRKITRPTNITIRNYDEWRVLIRTSNSINVKVHDKAKALASLEKYRYPITLGVYPPESVNPVQVYEQHPLDTCYMGWIPLKWKESIISWVELLLESNVINKNTSVTVEEELLKVYKRIRLAVYLRAQLLTKCTKQIIGNEKKELFKKYIDDEAPDDEKDDDEDEDWDPLLEEEIDIQSDSSSMSDGDTLTDIESDDEIELNLSDSEEEEDGNDDVSEEEIETTKDTRIKCNGDRCRIARRLSLDDGGWIKNEGTECARCKIFDTDQAFISILESNIRNNAKMKDATKLMQLNNKMKDAKSIIGKFLMNPRINPKSNKVYPRHINYIANDLLVTYSRKLPNIDQPLQDEDILRIKRQSHQICNCNNNEEVSYGEEEELPQLCQECNSIMTVPERSSVLHCITCNAISDSDNNINQNGVCQACQVVWLMQNNSLQSRVADMIRDNDDIDKNPVRAAAAKMIKDNETVTDPRIVKKNSKKDKESINHRVVQRSKSLSANTSNGDENLIDHLDRIWTSELEQTEVEQPPNERFDLLDKSRPMDNQTVMRLLNIFRKEVTRYHYGVVSATFIYQLQNTNTDWIEMRKNFQTADIDWPHLHDHVPYINQEFLLFPICISMGEQFSEWACMTRFEVEERADTPWAFMINAINNDSRKIKKLRGIIKTNTTLHLGERHMYEDEVYIPPEEEKDLTPWHHVQRVPSQANCESGFNMFLHFILMIGLKDIESINRRMSRLSEVENLEDKTRNWILEIVKGDRSFLQLPNWIRNIMFEGDESNASSNKEEDDEEEDDDSDDNNVDDDEDDDDDDDNSNDSNNKDGIDGRKKDVMSLGSSSSSSEIVEIVNKTNRRSHVIRKNATVGSIIPQPTTTQLRMNNVYFECDHLRPVLVRMSIATNAAIASLNFMDRLKQEQYVGWKECRKDLYPGTDNNFISIHQGQLTTARIDDNKLMIPIHMQGPPKHFLGIIRFKAKEEEDVTWNFAVIDSFDDSYLNRLHYMIESRSTLAHNIPNLSNNSPSPNHTSARWRPINCVQQEEVECGGRMALHFYIASKCNDIEEFQSKINRLSEINNLGRKVRNWLVDWYETEDEITPNTPSWLQGVIE